MASLTKTYDFEPDTTISPDEVNTDFDEIVAFVNEQVAHLDGPTFTGIPVLPASDPSSANEAARKSYVDSAIATAVAATVPTITKGLVQAGATDASGDATITHNFGSTPTAIFIQCKGGVTGRNGGSGVNTSVRTITSTTFTVRFHDSASSAALPGLLCTFYWMAV